MRKRVLISLLLIAVILSAMSLLAVLANSSPSSWAVDEVNEAIDAGVVIGSVKADYQANITREQFCEMVVLAYEKISGKTAEKGTTSFSDTSNSEILKAANLGIILGYGNGLFGPNDLITREQIATMLVRMIDAAVSYADVNVYNNNKFADSDSIDEWALPSVNFAYDKGIMQGVEGNKIDPLSNTTCEQAILLVYRTVEKYGIVAPDEENIVADEDVVNYPTATISRFNTIAEYNGKVYSGFESDNAIHVGEPGETTKFCILDDYIYYYHIHIGYVYGENYHDDFLQIWRTDLNGDNKTNVGFFEGDDFNTLTSDPYIINNKIYLSINQYDSASDEEVGWNTWVHDMTNATIYDNYGTKYLSGSFDILDAPDNAKYIINANDDYIFYQPYDPTQYMPPFATGLVIYDIQNDTFSTINTNSAVKSVFPDGNVIYYTTDTGMEQATYKYNIDSKENIKISDFCIHYLYNNVGYYIAKDGGINSINLSTLETTNLFTGYEYSSVILETGNYLYLIKSDSLFYGQIYVQYNKQTGEEKIIAKYEYPS